MNAPLVLTANRQRSSIPLSLWAVGLFLGGMLFLLDLSAWDGGRVLGHAYWGRDFANMWTAGHLIRDGQAGALYDVEAYRAVQGALFPGIGDHNYSYPPLSFPIAVLLSFLPYPLALVSWMAGTGWLFAKACRRWWPREAGPHWLVLLTPAALVNVWAGHYGFLLGALFLFGWQALDRAPVRAGVLFACMLIKPHLAVMVALALLVRREWTAIGAGVLTVTLLLLSTSLLFGWQAWWQFVTLVGPTQSAMIDAGDNLFGLMSTSVATALLRWPVPFSLALAAQILVALVALAMVAFAAWRGVRTRDLALLAATCTFLALPYAFNYDLTVVALGAVLAWTRARASWERVVAGAAFLAPAVGMALAYPGIPFIPLALAGLAALQVRQAVRATPAPAMFNFHTGPER